MKIMHFVSGLKSGGVEQMLTNYTKYVNKNNNVQEYVAYQHIPNIVSLNKLENAGNICIRIHSKVKHPLKHFLDTYHLIRKYKPNIVHTHMNLLNFIPLFIAFICGVKVRISHSHIAHRNINSKIAEYFFKIFNILFSNELVSCGQKAGEYMYGKHKFFIIPNCIDVSKFIFNMDSRKKIRKRLNIKDDEILLGNIGRLTNQKNQLFLLKLLKEILKINNKYKLIIIGDGEKKEKIIRKVKEYKLGDNFILNNPVNNISCYYNAMDIFLLPSLYEGFPISAIEAQASGLYTIMSNNIDTTSKLIRYAKFLNLNNNKKWLRYILNIKYNSRYIKKDHFNMYDISYNYNLLYEIYKEFLYEKSF